LGNKIKTWLFYPFTEKASCVIAINFPMIKSNQSFLLYFYQGVFFT